MLAHGITVEHWAAVAFGLAGTFAGIASMLRAISGRRGATLLSLSALLCAALILVVSVSEYYRNLGGLADAGLLGYELSFGEALRDAATEVGGFCVLPAALGLLGLLFRSGKSASNTGGEGGRLSGQPDDAAREDPPRS